MNQNRKAFYETVAREYIASGEDYLCHGSPTFNKEWRVAKRKIIEEATDFLKESAEYQNCRVNEFGLLFYVPLDIEFKIRRAFIHYMITHVDIPIENKG